jgi:colanic acid biosynthesis glycosyl transferase WcaI
MNILIVTAHFWPVNFKINDLVDGLKSRGHKMSVLTAIPDYPGGKFYAGFRLFGNNSEVKDSIPIFRFSLIPRGKGGGVRLALNYLSLLIGSVIKAFTLLNHKYDAVFVFQQSPITIGIPAILIKKIKKIPMLFWVLDLWPESILAASNLNSGAIAKSITPIVKFIYKESDMILVSSKGFIPSIMGKGIDRHKIHYFPQWAESIFKPLPANPNLLVNIPRDSFIIMFAGNIGEAQDFESIVEAAKTLRHDKRIHWVILGNGRKSSWVKKQIRELDLTSNFHMLGQLPNDQMPEYYAMSDAMLLSLKREYIFSLTVPAKIQTYLACGKPILAMMDGEGAQIVEDSHSGYTCCAENPYELSKNILRMANLSKNELTAFGENAVTYTKQKFNRTLLLDQCEKLLISAVAE